MSGCVCLSQFLAVAPSLDGAWRPTVPGGGVLRGREHVVADNDLGSLLGNLLGRGSSSGSGKMLGALFNGARSEDGNSLKGLLGQLRDGGLGTKVASWTGTGENEDISGAEIAQALPPVCSPRLHAPVGSVTWTPQTRSLKRCPWPSTSSPPRGRSPTKHLRN